MNKAIIKSMMKNPPAGKKREYIFVNDNKAICEAIVTVGYTSLYIASRDNGFFTVDTFCSYIRDIANMGTSIMNYTFVLACLKKKSNDTIGEVLKNNQIPYKQGAYTLFYKKEYLGKYEKQDEMEKILDDYIRRYEGQDDEESVDRTRFCRFGADGSIRGINDVKLVRYLMDTKCMFVINKELYVYQGGCYYLDDNGIRIKAIIQKLIPEQYITFRNLNAVYNLLLEQAELQKGINDINNIPPWWINFQNGIFDVREKKFRKHSPQYLFVNQIPHELDMAARERLNEIGEETERFLKNAIPQEDDRVMLWEYIGYCMTVDTRFQKMLIIRGRGGTGKSRVISLIQEVVGSRNYSNISLYDLNQRFYPSALYGKILNCCADIASDALTSVDNIKKATGEDVMIYEKKGKDIQSFRSFAKLLFSANKIPLNLDEKSNAFYRRLLILEMDHIPEKPDRDLDEKLKKELQYTIWMSLLALNKLYEDDRFAESARSQALVEELYRAADTVKAFMDECTEKKEGSRINRKDLYDKYVEYCRNYGRKEHGPNPFYKNLEEKGYICKRLAEGRYIWDVSFKDEGFLTDEENTAAEVFKSENSDRLVTG